MSLIGDAQRTGIYEGAVFYRCSSALLIGTIAYLLPKYRTSSRTLINTHVGRRRLITYGLSAYNLTRETSL